MIVRTYISRDGGLELVLALKLAHTDRVEDVVGEVFMVERSWKDAQIPHKVGFLILSLMHVMIMFRFYIIMWGQVKQH